MKKVASKVFLVIMIFMLSACGGGGGGGDSQQNIAPIAYISQTQVVFTGYETILSGSGSDQNGDTLTYEWTLKQKPFGSTATVGAVFTEQNIKFTPDASGSYIFGLIVNSTFAHKKLT